jgi:hypothetical protein
MLTELKYLDRERGEGERSSVYVALAWMFVCCGSSSSRQPCYMCELCIHSSHARCYTSLLHSALLHADHAEEQEEDEDDDDFNEGEEAGGEVGKVQEG